MAKGRSRAQKLQLRAVHQAKAQAQARISDSTEIAPRPARSLPAVRKELKTVQQRLKEIEADLENCRLSLEATHINLETKTIALQAAQGKSQSLHRELRTTKQKLKHTQTTKVEFNLQTIAICRSSHCQRRCSQGLGIA
jgi:chromosome segregation ATPase